MLTVHVLGPVEVHRDGRPIDLGGPQQRALIAHLALEPGRVVSVDRLVDRLWGDEPPRTALGTVQSYVSRLRRAIEPPRGPGEPPRVLVSEAPGYALRVAAEQVDLHRFRALAADARRSAAAGDHDAALATFDDALTLWRGDPLGGAGSEDGIRTLAVQLHEERGAAVEQRFDVLLAAGRHLESIPMLQAAIDDQPLRERLWELLALALYRSSRQAEALRALSTARSRLVEELGLEPGPQLRELEQRILAHDPALNHSARPRLPDRPDPRRGAPPGARAVTPPPPRLRRPEGRAPDRPELVGRSGEWQQLVDAAAAAAGGHPQLVLLEGEPGIGKSALGDAFVLEAAARGWRVAVGRSLEPGLAPSLWPWIEIVRQIAAMVPGPAAGSSGADLLAVLSEGSRHASPALTPIEVAARLLALLDADGTTDEPSSPWLLLLDDLHWADRASLDVLRLLLEGVGDRLLLLVGAHRPPRTEPGSLLGDALGTLRRTPVNSRCIELTPLDAAAVAQLIESVAGVAAPGSVAGRVRDRAGGNPLFVVELARLAGERGLTAQTEVPPAIRDVVRSRLGQLPERATAELEVAAVLGERFDLRTVMAASERDPDSCLDALDAAIVTRILVADADGYRFAHALVRDAVLADTSPLRLARLHARAAEAITTVQGDGADVAEPVAHHRLAAATFTDPLVVARSAARASDVARWRGSLDTAEWFAERALEAVAGIPRNSEAHAVEVAALESLASAAFRRSDARSAADVARRGDQLAARTGSDAVAALALFLNWGDVDGTDDLRDVSAAVEAARVLGARTTDRYAIVTTSFMVAAAALFTGRLDEAAEHVARAVAASGSIEPDIPPDHVPLVLLPVVAGIVEALRDEPASAREHSQRRARVWFASRAEVDPTTAVALTFNRALVEALLDDVDGVLAEVGAPTPANGARLAGLGFVRHELATCDLLGGWARVRSGDPTGLAVATAALERVEREGEQSLRSCLRTFVADACLCLDDRRAVELLAQARAEAVRRGEVWWLAETLRLSAVADLRFAGAAHAGGLLDEADDLAAEQGARLLQRRIAQTRATTLSHLR